MDFNNKSISILFVNIFLCNSLIGQMCPGTNVSNESELVSAIQSDQEYIVLTSDISLNNRLTLDYPVIIESCGTKKSITSNEAFLITGNSITLRNIQFEGDGTGVAITCVGEINDIVFESLHINNHTRAIFKSGAPSNPESNRIRISNCVVTNSKITGASGTVHFNWNVQDLIIENLIIDNCTGEGLEIANGCAGKISDVTIKNTAFIGLELFNITNNTYPYNSFEISNISVRDSDNWGISFHGSRVVASNLSTHNTKHYGVEIVAGSSYAYYPVQISNVIVSGVKSPSNAIGISIDQHSGTNISNFHIEGLDINPDTGLPQSTFGIQVRLSEHFSIHDGQFIDMFRGVMVQGGSQLARNGSIMNNRFLDISGTIVFNNGTNVDTLNNVSW